MNDRMLCQSCSEQRNELHSIESKIIAGYRLTLCTICIRKQLEPRFVVILALQKSGLTPEIQNIVQNQRYHGPIITLSEYINVDK